MRFTLRSHRYQFWFNQTPIAVRHQRESHEKIKDYVKRHEIVRLLPEPNGKVLTSCSVIQLTNRRGDLHLDIR